MKKLTLLVNTIVLALTVTVSVQAAELVKVDTLDNSVLTANVSTELAQSLKAMSTLTLNVKESAETILVVQSEKRINSVELETTILAAIAE